MKYGKKFWFGLVGTLPAGIIMGEAMKRGWQLPLVLLAFHFSISAADPWWDECFEEGRKTRERIEQKM